MALWMCWEILSSFMYIPTEYDLLIYKPEQMLQLE